MATYFEVTILGTRASQQIVNRCNFTSSIDSVESTNAEALLTALGVPLPDVDAPTAGSFLARFLAAQTTAYQIDEILVRNLFSVTDFITQVLTGPDWAGSIVVAAGDALPVFVASKLKTNRVRTDVRRGTMALTGGTEEMVEGSDQWNSTYMTLLEAVATALNAPPTFVDGIFTTLYLPSVFGKERYPVPGSDPVRYAYRYYTDPTVFAAHAAVGVTWSASADVTSQVSRKLGRGS